MQENTARGQREGGRRKVCESSYLPVLSPEPRLSSTPCEIRLPRSSQFPLLSLALATVARRVTSLCSIGKVNAHTRQVRAQKTYRLCELTVAPRHRAADAILRCCSRRRATELVRVQELLPRREVVAAARSVVSGPRLAEGCRLLNTSGSDTSVSSTRGRRAEQRAQGGLSAGQDMLW